MDIYIVILTISVNLKDMDIDLQEREITTSVSNEVKSILRYSDFNIDIESEVRRERNLPVLTITVKIESILPSSEERGFRLEMEELKSTLTETLLHDILPHWGIDDINDIELVFEQG
jgi:hypothetical protein